MQMILIGENLLSMYMYNFYRHNVFSSLWIRVKKKCAVWNFISAANLNWWKFFLFRDSILIKKCSFYFFFAAWYLINKCLQSQSSFLPFLVRDVHVQSCTLYVCDGYSSHTKAFDEQNWQNFIVKLKLPVYMKIIIGKKYWFVESLRCTP